ncbi:hypothetical protein ACFQY7_06250 [Actinomadura luteofluorescens]|uniref:hypothetical protein n=1 Tax=Actinomadura luteofluorescens TaxID=46163 RepID=UPI00362B82C7
MSGVGRLDGRTLGGAAVRLVSTPNTATTKTASSSGTAPSNAVVLIDGTVAPATSTTVTATPPSLPTPADSPDPRERIRVG